MKKQPLLNTYVNNLDMQETILLISRMIEEKKKSFVVAVNVDVIMKIESDNILKRIVDNADIVIVDGKPLVWISKFYKKQVKEKISGSDLVPELCSKAAEKGYSIYIIGGAEGVAEKARVNLEKWYPGINIVGTYAPPYGFETDKNELEKINLKISEKHPDLLISCFGCPKQEKFIYNNYYKYNATVSICAGATVDFISGNVKRAPKWMSDIGLEWFYRFLQEPGRMFKRYFIDDIKILPLILKYHPNRNKK